MQVSVETTSTIERRMTIGVPREHVESKIQSRFKSLAHQTKINGFRPGKAPLRVIEQKYGQKVRDEIVNEVMHTTFKEALEQEKITPISKAIFDLKGDAANSNEDLSYTATFEVYPEIATLHVDGLVVEKPVAAVSEADIEKMLLMLRQQRQTFNEVDHPASDGDRVIIDLVGTIDGQPFKGNEVKQAPVLLGQNKFSLPGIEQELFGVKKEDERELDLTFPKDHSNPELAGQTVHFVIQVTKVATPQLPEIDSDFVKEFGVPSGRIEELRVEARKNMELELKQVVNSKIKQQVLDALLEVNPVDAPPSFVNDEAQRLAKTRQQEWQVPNLSVDMFIDAATKRVKIGILIGELIKAHQLRPEPNKVRQLIEQIAFTYEEPDVIIREYYADEQRLKEVESVVLEDQVVAWLLERAAVTEKKIDFYTAVNEPSLMPKEEVAQG